MFRGIPMGYQNKVSRPSAGFMINKTQLRFKNCTDNTYIDTCLHHQSLDLPFFQGGEK